MKKTFLYFILFTLIISIILAVSPTKPTVTYPDTTGLKINKSLEINWTVSKDSDGDIVKYHIFYSNDSGGNWTIIGLNKGYTNYLNNSNTKQNFTFSGPQNNTFYISIPRIANITSAKLNLTGYENITGPYREIYTSLTDEAESDGDEDGSASAVSFGRSGSYYPIDMFFLVYTPPTGDVSKIEIRIGPTSNQPETKNFTYNIYVAETDDYLSGDPRTDNTTVYTKVKSNFRVSEEFGNINNIYRNITFDIPYTMSSAKKYIIWSEFVSGVEGINSAYTVMMDDNPVENHTGEFHNVPTSYTRIVDFRLWNVTKLNASDPWLEIGNIDGVHEWNLTGNFTITQNTTDFNATLNSYITSNCSSLNLWEDCKIPFTIHSNKTGKIEISSINIQYTDYWWNTTNIKEAKTYRINITPTDTTSNGSSDISDNDFTITHRKPNTTLNNPSSSYSNSTSDPFTITFNCSATDDYGLVNISLYITNPINQSFSLNQTINLSGTTNETTWTLNLSNGNYTWNCLTYDAAENHDWAENRSITINYVASTPTTPSSGASSWSGGKKITLGCKTDYECKKGYICENYKCKPTKLFDVKIIKVDSPIKPKNFFSFTYLVKAVADIKGDVIIDFSLEKDNQIITSGSDTIYFQSPEEKTEITKLFLPSTTPNGIYDFYVKSTYESYQAEAHRKIEVIHNKENDNETAKIETTSSATLDIFNKTKLYFKISIKLLIKNIIYIIIVIGSLTILLLLIIFIPKLKKKKEHDITKITNTYNLEVYSEDGNKIGTIKDALITKNKIYGWLIKPDKRIAEKIKKNVLIKHKDIIAIKQIMIVNKKISEHLGSFNPSTISQSY